MVGQSLQRLLTRVAGITASTAIFTLCFLGALIEVYVPFITTFQVSHFLLFGYFVCLALLAIVCGMQTMARGPGKVPEWMSTARVDAFVVEELRRLASGPRSHPPLDEGDYASYVTPAEEHSGQVRGVYEPAATGAGTGEGRAPLPAGTPAVETAGTGDIAFLEDSDHDEEAGVRGAVAGVHTAPTTAAGSGATRTRQVSLSDMARANDMLTQALQVRTAFEDDHTAMFAEAPATEDEGDNADTTEAASHFGGGGRGGAEAFPLDHPDRMDERRQRKRRHGLRTRTVADVAYEAMCRIQSDLHDDRDAHRGPIVSIARAPATKEEQMAVLLLGAGHCRFCRCYKLQETHHCSTCGRCVHRMDHHCGWLGTCVAANNQKAFLLFLVNTTLACVVTTATALHNVYTGRHFMFSETEVNLGLFLTFTFVSSFGLVLLPFTAQHVYSLGCGESTLMAMRREDQQTRQRIQRRVVDSALYEPVLVENEDAGPRRFDWHNLRNAFGLARVFPDWFVPVSPVWPPAAEREETFWSEVRDMVEHQVYSIADSTGEGLADDARPSSIAAVPVRDAIDDLTNVRIDLVEDDFHAPFANVDPKRDPGALGHVPNHPAAGVLPDSAPGPQAGRTAGPPRAATLSPHSQDATGSAATTVAVGSVVNEGASLPTSSAPVTQGVVRGAEVKRIHRKDD